MNAPQLHRLPEAQDWASEVRALEGPAESVWRALTRLANTRLDFVRTGKLDRIVQQLWTGEAPLAAGGSVRGGDPQRARATGKLNGCAVHRPGIPAHGEKRDRLRPLRQTRVPAGRCHGRRRDGVRLMAVAR
jgi:hypothetical protein